MATLAAPSKWHEKDNPPTFRASVSKIVFEIERGQVLSSHGIRLTQSLISPFTYLCKIDLQEIISSKYLKQMRYEACQKKI